MAAVRPIVLVYQDFASPSVSVDVPDMNVVVVGPCYQIEDYLADKANLLLTTIGSKTTTPTGSASAGSTISATNIPNVVAGGTVDDSSLSLFVDAGFAEIAAAGDGAITANQNTLTSSGANFLTSGVKVGDRVVISIVSGDTTVVAKTVQSITSATVLVLTDNFIADTTGTAQTDITGAQYTITLATTSRKYRIERPVSDTLVDESCDPDSASNQASTDSAVACLVDIAGVQTAKKITYGKVYAQYRALRTDISGSVLTINGTADALTQLGKVDERNPLAVGVQLALANTNKKVQALGISGDNLNGASDTLTQYTVARDVLNGDKSVYCIVPLTQDLSTITMFKNHVAAVSDPSISKFRIVIGSGTLPVTQQISPVSGTSTGTVETNDGTHRNLLDNTATFITSGVQIGDNVVISATNYAVTAILSENRVTLLGQPGTGSTSYKIVRTLTKAQQITALEAVTAGLKNSRCTMIWPDSCSLASVKNNLTGVASNQPGYYIACAVGGMVSGLPPHQGFTFIGLAGITQTFHSNTYFTDDQIDALGNAGWYVVVQDTPLADPYSIHELTTDTTTLETGELMVVKNFDFVSLTYRNALTGFLGIYNVISETNEILTVSFNAVTAALLSQRFPKIGAPLISATLDSIGALAGSKDRIEMYASVQIPRPLNRIGLHLTA